MTSIIRLPAEHDDPTPESRPEDQDQHQGSEQELAAPDMHGGELPPLFHVMAALPESGATTLAAWCGCTEELVPDSGWRPEPGQSPWLVLTAPKTPDGVRAARQLAGALSRTVGGGARVAAIALLEDQPRPTLALRELIAAAERAGIPIHTLAHDSRMRLPRPDDHEELWTPQNAETTYVPKVLDNLYRHVFHHITEKETNR